MRLLTLAALTLLAHSRTDRTGAPAFGPADVVIEGNRITDVAIVGFPGVPVNPQKRPCSARVDARWI